MLILSRRAGDAVLIGGAIRIVVLACDRRGVRIGIEAPDDVSILREEILAQVADENKRAGTTAGHDAIRALIRVKPPENESQGSATS